MKRILISGGSGFVGANLTRRVVKDGHEVHLLLRPEYKFWRIQDICQDIRIHIARLSDIDTLMQLISKIRPDWIFHLAVYGAYSYQCDRRQILHTNLLGTINLLEACLAAEFEAFINTGSSSEYGFKAHPPSETEWLDPNSYYAVSKSSATLFCRYTAKAYDLHIPTLRLFSVYGPYEEPGRLIPTLIIKGLSKQLPSLVNQNVARDLVYIDDVVEAYVLAASLKKQERGAVYNVGTGKQMTLQDIISVARNALNIEQEPEWGSMPNREWDTTVWVSDSRKIMQQLGWCPHHTFEQGFKKTLDWFRQTSHMQKFYRNSCL